MVVLKQRTCTDYIYVTVEWEGPDAVEESSNIAPTPPREPTPPPMDESDDEDVSEAKIDSDSDEAASEDEYVVNENETSAKTSDKVRIL